MTEQDHAAAPRALPSHIVVLGHWKLFPPGRVMVADADVIAQLDRDAIEWREATAFERRIGGFDVKV